MKKYLTIFIIAVICFWSLYLIAGNNLINKQTGGGGEMERVLGRGEHFFPKGLIVEKGEVLMVKPGAHLKMGEGSWIEVRGRIIARGTKENPIVFSGNNNYWRGIIIEGTESSPKSENFWEWIKEGDSGKEKLFFSKIQKGNVFDYCNFRNIAAEDKKCKCGILDNKWRASIEAYNTSIDLSNSNFEDILNVGAVLTQGSYFIVRNNFFGAPDIFKVINSMDNSVGIIYKNKMVQQKERQQRCSDGIWMQNSTALISSNIIQGLADDGIDLETSHSVIVNNKINAVCDEGIDIDRKSESYIIQNTVEKAAESGILVSDNSRAVLADNQINDSKWGLTLRNGSTVTGSELIIKDNQIGLLLCQSIPCVLSEKDFLKLKKQISGSAQLSTQLVKELENSFTKQNHYYLFNKEYFSEDLRHALKGSVLFELDYITDVENHLSPFCSPLPNNSLCLSSSSIKNNKKDVAPYHEYEMQTKNTVFSSKRIAEEVRKLETDNLDCSSDFADKLDISSVFHNSQRIVERMANIQY